MATPVVVAGASQTIAQIIAEALAALNAVLGVLAGLHANGGLTADQMAAATQQLLQSNNQLYAALIAALQPATKPA